MIRKIITIDETKCNGCGLCADACHEGAIGLVNGKATLLREDYCDGLGDCLPACPMNAISFEEREALAYDEVAVLAAKRAKEASLSGACSNATSQTIYRGHHNGDVSVPSELANFPVQIKLLPPHAPYFNDADLLIAADCTAFTYGNFHHDFMKKHITMIGCPKLDAIDYAEKLSVIFKTNNIRTITVVRMTVPCCGGLSHAVATAINQSGKDIPLRIVTISPDGFIIK